MIRILPFIIVVLIMSCSTDGLDEEVTLDSSLVSKEVVIDNVIACAASNKNDNSISVYFYPRPGASNFQYFETEDTDADKDNFDEYVPVIHSLEDIFNGYLKKFDLSSEQEKWVIVSFDEGGKTHLSNPIRLKQLTKPTEYLPQNILIDASSTMPNFSWQDGSYTDTKIYFQVVSDVQNNLISGTYTFERMFQYYRLDNVVLNITKDIPEVLKANTSYNFTLLSVSEDNWVNMFAETPFTPR